MAEGRFFVKRSMDPFQELGLSPSASPQQTKSAYGARANLPRRQQRVTASLAYHMISSTDERRYKRRGREYEIKNRDDQFFLATTGYTSRLQEVLHLGSDISRVDERGRTSLYIAARCGFYDTTKALLEAGAPVNQVQHDGSTPLHGAAYYCQVPVVKLLLSYGADPNLKNKWGCTAAGETSNADIKKLVLEYKEDKIASFAREFISKGLATNIRCVKDRRGVEIARQILRNYEATESTKQEWDEKVGVWEPCWHGTKSHFIESILKYGLHPSGAKIGDVTITPPKGHIQLGRDCMGKKNWAAAIFVSPSLLYASDEVYAELMMSGGVNWRVVVRVRVEPNTYSEHESTLVSKYAPIDSEPENSEYRIVSTGEDKIRRVESARHVVVTSVVFIKASFLEEVTKSQDITYEELLQCFGEI